MLPDPKGTKVAIVSGSYGAGHDAAAREIGAVLTARGAEVETFDVAGLLPAGLGGFLKHAYYTQLRCAPSTWGTTLSCVKPGKLVHRAAVGMFGLGDERIVRAVAGSDLVIATHPFAGQALGCARKRGILSVPAVTYLTDASVHSLWVNPHVDLHLAIHDVAAVQARALGGRTVTVQPVVGHPAPAGPFLDPLAAYEIFGPRALVTGGSLGIGELEAAARDLLATGLVTPIVACGSNDALRDRLARVPGVVALGWRDDLPAVIAASDCLVQNAGGFTSLEALSAGTPVLTYRPIPGHGVSNAENLERAGLAPWPRTPEALADALGSVLAAGRRDRIPHDAPTLVEALAGAWPAHRSPGWAQVA